MRDKYSEETINKLVRQALALEKNNKFAEALSIYYDLASEDNEYAIDRIPLVKYKEDQFRLRKVNYFIGIISVLTIGTALATVTINTINNIYKADKLSKETHQTYISTANNSSQFDYDSMNVNYHTVEMLDKKNLDSTLEIFVPDNITATKLKERVLEGIDTYSSEAASSNGELYIAIKTYSSKDIVGYVQFDTKKTDSCEVYVLKP